MKRSWLYHISTNLFLVIALFAAYGRLYPALAGGPGTGSSKLRFDGQIGPYTLLVATAPTPLTIGQISVWVRVTDPETNNLPVMPW